VRVDFNQRRRIEVRRRRVGSCLQAIAAVREGLAERIADLARTFGAGRMGGAFLRPVSTRHGEIGSAPSDNRLERQRHVDRDDVGRPTRQTLARLDQALRFRPRARRPPSLRTARQRVKSRIGRRYRHEPPPARDFLDQSYAAGLRFGPSGIDSKHASHAWSVDSPPTAGNEETELCRSAVICRKENFTCP
jgi:hypothetical protein